MKAIRSFLALFATATLVSSAQADWLWTRKVVVGVGTIRTLAYGNGIFVAGTNSGYALSSRDGVNWTTSRPTTNSINDLVFGNGRFVASVASSDGIKGKIIYSFDGVSWTFARRVSNGGRFSSNSNLPVVGSKSGHFIGLGGSSSGFASSATGTRWQDPLRGKPAKYVGSATGLATSGNYIVCSTQAGATIQTSPDGTSWTTRFTNSSRGPARGIAALKPGKRVICVGENGLCLTSGNAGLTWNSEPFGSVDFLGVADANRQFVSIADKFVYSTPSGFHWTRQLKVARSGDHLRAIAGGVGLYIAAGNTGKNGVIFVSSGLPAPATGP